MNDATRRAASGAFSQVFAHVFAHALAVSALLVIAACIFYIR